jgi:nucleotidyltransferase substrate binding protein (TIGR01987 family)
LANNKVVHELAKAVASLQESMDLYERAATDSAEQKAFRDACIQRFEYCLELSWKTSMKLLGQSVNAAKPAVREMARNDLISDPSLWISFVDARNSTSHSYDEEVARMVFEKVQIFLPKVKDLLSGLQKI